MKHIFYLLLINSIFIPSFSQTVYPNVVLETTAGNMVLMLYDDTPFHSENFTKLVNEGYYNNQLFHRVIKDFMIQAGDPNSKTAQPGEALGYGGPDYSVPAEFIPEYYHKRGAIAAARQPDNINPNKESSGSQFYIVQGKSFSEAELDAMVSRSMHIPFTPEQKELYTSSGGYPPLDYEYTVFGELIEGFDILKLISEAPTDQRNRPNKDIRILKAYTSK